MHTLTKKKNFTSVEGDVLLSAGDGNVAINSVGSSSRCISVDTRHSRSATQTHPGIEVD